MPILLLLLGLFQQKPAATAPLQPAPGNPIVVIDTSAGPITVELFKDQAPVSVDNFLQYVREAFYPGTIWHRVVSGYVIQAGGYTSDLGEKPTRPPIQNEATNGLSNRKGTLAMARTHAARSATSQFFINLVDNPGLDHHGFAPEDFGYAVFGRVIDGWDTVTKIASVQTMTTRDGMENVPVTPIIIKSVTLRGRE
jgi:cyclophilin family peptidyl-prolyl cis-trans isomerase